MNEAPYSAWLITTAIAAVAGQVVAAARDEVALSILMTALFVVVALFVTFRLNAADPLKRDDAAAQVGRAVTNSFLLAATFAWGGTAILAAYLLTDLFWHHAWQYGLAMLIIATALLFYRRRLQQRDRNLVSPMALRISAWLALIQAIAALAGLSFLFASGKLARHNPDWIANHVFVAGGTIVIVVSLTAYFGRSRSRQD